MTLGEVDHLIGEEAVIGLSVVVESVRHEGDGKLGNGVLLVVQGLAVDLLDGRVVVDETHEVVDYVGQEESEEHQRAHDRTLGGDCIILGHWQERKDVDDP